MEYKFGLCYCDLNISNEIKNLIVFDEYEEVFKAYMRELEIYFNFKENPRWIYPDLWIVWIRKSDNKIEQFEQLSWKTNCKLINIK